MIEEFVTSEIVLSKIGNKTNLVGSKIYRPLKIFSLSRGNNCQLIFSNYGGGLVEGDVININIHCGKNTTTSFATQANTRVYKSINGRCSHQSIKVKMEEDSFAVYLGDPLVPHAESIFQQEINWELKNSCVLLFGDWFVAGRILNGERFAFNSFSSELLIKIDDRIVVLDRFKIVPQQINPDSPGAFHNHSCYLNLFLVGEDNNPKSIKSNLILTNLLNPLIQKMEMDKSGELPIWGTLVKISEKVTMVRLSAKNPDQIQPLVKELAFQLSDKELLGFNPLEGRV